MITKKHIFNEIALGIEENLRDVGFKYRKSDGRILRRYSGGFDVILLTVLDYGILFQTEMFFAIRFDKVEDTINKFIPNRNPAYMKYTETLGTSYMVLSGSKENHIEIKTQEELNKTINDLIILIKTKGLEYFEKYRNIEVVNALKKKQILTENNSINYVISNLMQSLTLLKLCNDPDFDKLCIKYKELYIPFAGDEESGRKAMDDLIEYLKGLN